MMDSATGLAYGSTEPVVVRVREREGRVVVDDDGRAVELAGRPDGWRDLVERLVASRGVNVNRRGVVFVPTVAGRDVDRLVTLVAETSLEVYAELMDLTY